MTQSEIFLSEIDAFLERSGMTATAFGKAALKDPNLVSDLRSGRSPRLDLVDRVQAFIRSHDAERAA